MRLLATVFLLATGFAPAAVHADALDRPAGDTVRVTVPTGRSVRARPADEMGVHLAQRAAAVHVHRAAEPGHREGV